MKKKINIILIILFFLVISIYFYKNSIIADEQNKVLQNYEKTFYNKDENYNQNKDNLKNDDKGINNEAESSLSDLNRVGKDNSKDKDNRKYRVYKEVKNNNQKNNKEIYETDLNKGYVEDNNQDVFYNNKTEDVIGELKIPSLKKHIAIFNGVSENMMLKGACSMKKNQSVEGGNLALCGHYIQNKKLLFGGVVEMNIGDIIIVKTRTGEYKYKVFKTEKTNDERFDLIQNDVAEKFGIKKPIITLMTCYYNKPNLRFFVFGERVDN